MTDEAVDGAGKENSGDSMPDGLAEGVGDIWDSMDPTQGNEAQYDSEATGGEPEDTGQERGDVADGIGEMLTGMVEANGSGDSGEAAQPSSSKAADGETGQSVKVKPPIEKFDGERTGDFRRRLKDIYGTVMKQLEDDRERLKSQLGTLVNILGLNQGDYKSYDELCAAVNDKVTRWKEGSGESEFIARQRQYLTKIGEKLLYAVNDKTEDKEGKNEEGDKIISRVREHYNGLRIGGASLDEIMPLLWLDRGVTINMETGREMEPSDEKPEYYVSLMRDEEKGEDVLEVKINGKLKTRTGDFGKKDGSLFKRIRALQRSYIKTIPAEKLDTYTISSAHVMKNILKQLTIAEGEKISQISHKRLVELETQMGVMASFEARITPIYKSVSDVEGLVAKDDASMEEKLTRISSYFGRRKKGAIQEVPEEVLTASDGLTRFLIENGLLGSEDSELPPVERAVRTINKAFMDYMRLKTEKDVYEDHKQRVSDDLRRLYDELNLWPALLPYKDRCVDDEKGPSDSEIYEKIWGSLGPDILLEALVKYLPQRWEILFGENERLQAAVGKKESGLLAEAEGFAEEAYRLKEDNRGLEEEIKEKDEEIDRLKRLNESSSTDLKITRAALDASRRKEGQPSAKGGIEDNIKGLQTGLYRFVEELCKGLERKKIDHSQYNSVVRSLEDMRSIDSIDMHRADIGGRVSRLMMIVNCGFSRLKDRRYAFIDRNVPPGDEPMDFEAVMGVLGRQNKSLLGVGEKVPGIWKRITELKKDLREGLGLRLEVEDSIADYTAAVYTLDSACRDNHTALEGISTATDGIMTDLALLSGTEKKVGLSIDDQFGAIYESVNTARRYKASLGAKFIRYEKSKAKGKETETQKVIRLAKADTMEAYGVDLTLDIDPSLGYEDWKAEFTEKVKERTNKFEALAAKKQKQEDELEKIYATLRGMGYEGEAKHADVYLWVNQQAGKVMKGDYKKRFSELEKEWNAMKGSIPVGDGLAGVEQAKVYVKNQIDEGVQINRTKTHLTKLRNTIYKTIEEHWSHLGEVTWDEALEKFKVMGEHRHPQ